MSAPINNTDNEHLSGEERPLSSPSTPPPQTPVHNTHSTQNVSSPLSSQEPAIPAPTVAVLHASLDPNADPDIDPERTPVDTAPAPTERFSTVNGDDGDDGDDDNDDNNNPSTSNAPFPKALAARLYISHFLSTWNARLFEFAAVLFLAAIFPDTLLPMSVYAVVRGVAAMVFAEAVGACIDRGDRLAVVRASILGQRAAVVVSCGVFWVMMDRAASSSPSVVRRESPLELTPDTGSSLSLLDAFFSAAASGLTGNAVLVNDSSPATPSLATPLSSGLFAVAVIAACIEKLGSVMNLVAVERDWIVVMTEGNPAARRLLSARMRRIDLFCKLVGPLTISLVAAASIRVALWTTLGMSAASVVIEYFCIAVVYRRVPDLHRQPAWTATPTATTTAPTRRTRTTLISIWSGVQTVARRLIPFASMPLYWRHPAFLPSFALALLYLTVLSFSGQMVTFLLAAGYTPLYVGVARTISTVFELSATWIAPRLMARLGVVRGGIWSLSWQALWLTGATAAFFVATSSSQSNGGGLVGASCLAAGVALSRIGLWGYDLCAQNIVQDEVVDAQRGAFSTAEAAFQNLFEVLAYATTIVWSRPDQFRWPVVVSVAAVYTASALYTTFVRQRRGHLFHSPLPPAQRWLEKTFARREGM
ncbi:hypothetical protein SBRCBS47491_008228 [Sporothrix bragantina]|uniref:Solute carrier family 40 member n=1 Tax=Sporothrix bragantina TaxID=671064 RepID=A0ABP0CJN7_9PEZI